MCEIQRRTKRDSRVIYIPTLRSSSSITLFLGNAIQCVTINLIAISMEKVKSVFMKDCNGKRDSPHLGKLTNLNHEGHT